MRKIHEILRLHFNCKLSYREIASSCSVSRATVADYVYRARAADLGWPLPGDCDESRLERLLFSSHSGRPKTTAPMPDFVEMHEKLKQKGMTLALLWERYKKDNSDGFQYSHFCDLYREWSKQVDVVMRQTHQAGEKLFSDFAGTKLRLTDSVTGEISNAHLFVTAAGASSFTYAEAFPAENSEAWCVGHANAFSYMGGVTEKIVPDNPRSVVNKPSPYEPDLHADFQYMASFFGAAVIPARVAKPRDKAKVEAAVRVATMWIIAALRDRTFFSLAELNSAIKELLENLNNRPFKKMPGSRRSVFEETERPALQPLPESRYQYTKIGYARAGLDYHISVDDHLYSVPYEQAKQKLEYRLTPKTLEVFFQGKRIASHHRLWIQGKSSTLKEHMPSHHLKYQDVYVEWTPERVMSWAAQIGQSTATAAESIMRSKPHPELGFRACLGVIRLARSWGNAKVDAACRRAVELNACSYKYIKLILESGSDTRPTTPQLTLSIAHDNVRGPEYYKEQTTEENENADTSNTRESTPPQAHRNDTGFGIADANA